MTQILSWTTKKASKNIFQATKFKVEEIQGLCKDLHRNLRTFQGLPLKFKDFLRLCEPCARGEIKYQASWPYLRKDSYDQQRR